MDQVQITNIEMVVRFCYSELSGDRVKYPGIPDEIVNSSRKGVSFECVDAEFFPTMFVEILKNSERNGLAWRVLQYDRYKINFDYDLRELFVVPALWAIAGEPEKLVDWVYRPAKDCNDPRCVVKHWDDRPIVGLPIVTLYDGRPTVVDGTTRLTHAVLAGQTSSNAWVYVPREISFSEIS